MIGADILFRNFQSFLSDYLRSIIALDCVQALCLLVEYIPFYSCTFGMFDNIFA